MSPVREDVVARALKDVAAALQQKNVDYLAIGGIAAAVAGIDKPVRDIDIFLSEEDIESMLEALGERGFERRDSDEDWLAKAVREDILVDLIHRIDRRIRLTPEMIERGRVEDVMGTEIRVVGTEDLVLSLAITDKPDTHYWKDALIILGRSDVDWDYLLERAEEDPTRMLALLLHAVAYEIDVPPSVLAALARMSPALEEVSRDAPVPSDAR